MQNWQLIGLTALLSLVGQVIFYLIISRRFERNKAQYNGVVSKRIEVYQTLLQKLLKMRRSIIEFASVGSKDEELNNEVLNNLASFREECVSSEPFLDKSLVEMLNKITKELNSISVDTTLYYLTHEDHFHVSSEQKKDLGLKYLDSLNKMLGDGIIEDIHREIISQMRKDLGTDK